MTVGKFSKKHTLMINKGNVNSEFSLMSKTQNYELNFFSSENFTELRVVSTWN